MTSWSDTLIETRKAAKETTPPSLTGMNLNRSMPKAAPVVKTRKAPAFVKPPTQEERKSQALDEAYKKGGWEGFSASAAKVADTPVIKQLIDALSVFTYIGANAADNAMTEIDRAKKGDFNPARFLTAGMQGVGQGLSAAVGNDNDVKTFSDVIKHGMKTANVDAENDAAKWIQGIGGFVGDVALDPTTYLSLGGTAIAKGASRGFVEGGRAATRKAKEGLEKAGEAGKEVVGKSTARPGGRSLEELANQTPGLPQRLKLAKEEAGKDYALWKEANDGKGAVWGLPFSRQKMSKAEGAVPVAQGTKINPEQEVRNYQGVPVSDALKEDNITALTKALEPNKLEEKLRIPIENAMHEINPKATNKEVLEESGLLKDEVTPLPKDVTPKVSDAVKQVNKELNDPEGDLGKLKNLLDNYEFQAPHYTNQVDIKRTFDAANPRQVKKMVDVPEGTAVAKVAPAAAGDLPQGANKAGKPAASSAVSYNPLDVLADLNTVIRKAAKDSEKSDVAQMFKFGTTSKSAKEMADMIENAVVNGGPAVADRILKRLDPAFVRPFLEKLTRPAPSKLAPKAAPVVKPKQQEVIEEIPGTPVTSDMLNSLGISLEHQLLSVDEILGLTKKTTNGPEIKKAVKKLDDAELAKVAELLGHPNWGRQEITTFLSKPNLFGSYNKALKTIATEAKKLPKKEVEHSRNIDGVRETSGREYEQLKDIVLKNPEYVRTRQLNNAVKAEEALATGVTKADGESVITGRELKLISDEMLATFIKHQGDPTLVHKTARKYITDTTDIKTGNVSHPGLAPTYSAIEPFMKAVTELRKFQSKASLHERLQALLKVSQAFDTKSRALGFNPTLNLARQPQNTLTANLSFFDVIDIVHSIKSGDQLLIKHLISGPDSGLQITTFMSAVEGLIRGAHKGLSPQDLENSIFKILIGEASAYPLYKKTSKLVQNYIQKVTKGNKAAYYQDMQKLAAKITYDPDLLHLLNDRMKLNALEHGVNVRAPIQQATDAQQAIIREMAIDPTKSAGDYINQIMVEAKKDIVGDTPREARDLANKMLDELKARTLTIPEQSAIEHGIRVRDAIKSGQNAVNKANAARGADAKITDEVTSNLKADPDVPVAKDGEPYAFDVINAEIATHTWRRIHPAASFFNARYGLDDLVYRDINTGNHTVANMINSFHNNVIKYLEKNKATAYQDWDQLVKVMALARHTNEPPAIGMLSPSGQDLYNAISTVVDPSDMNVFATSGIASAHFNAMAKKKNLDKYIPENGWMDDKLTPQENTLNWIDAKNINNADDVFDFLSRYDAVITHTASEISIAASFQKHFASDSPQKGWVKIGEWSKRKDNDHGFYDLLDKNKYYDPQAVYQISRVHEMLNESRSFSTATKLGKFITNVFDPITNFLKASQTTMRPGHWVMSFEGDMLRNGIAGVTTLTPYKDSIGIMTAMHLDTSVFGTDPMSALRYARQNAFGGYQVTTNANVKKNLPVNIGGKVQLVSHQSFGRMMSGTVTIPGFRGGVLEDYLVDQTSGLSQFAQNLNKGMDWVLNNQKFNVNRLAAQRDNFSRLALASDFARKGKFKDFEDLKRKIEDHITKWAPVSTDFSAKESKYARRTMLYYTWLRGITPRVFDLMMTKPGTFTAVNKALYNFAVTQGIDPISIGNPFPPEGLFPSYYYNNVIGPQWQDRDNKGGMWGINPSSPVIEVLNSLGKGITPAGIMDPMGRDSAVGKVGANLLNMSTPFFKTVIEPITGQSGGVPIKDNVQYYQDALGGSWMSAASKASGQLITGQGRTDSSNKLGPEAQQEQALTQLINFMTGSKLTNFQSDSALRSYFGEKNEERQNMRLDMKRNM